MGFWGIFRAEATALRFHISNRLGFGAAARYWLAGFTATNSKFGPIGVGFYIAGSVAFPSGGTYVLYQNTSFLNPVWDYFGELWRKAGLP